MGIDDPHDSIAHNSEVMSINTPIHLSPRPIIIIVIHPCEISLRGWETLPASRKDIFVKALGYLLSASPYIPPKHHFPSVLTGGSQ